MSIINKHYVRKLKYFNKSEVREIKRDLYSIDDKKYFKEAYLYLEYIKDVNKRKKRSEQSKGMMYVFGDAYQQLMYLSIVQNLLKSIYRNKFNRNIKTDVDYRSERDYMRVRDLFIESLI